MSSQVDFPKFVRALPEIKLPYPKTRGWLLQGQSQQIVFMEFHETVEIPRHSHAEQWEFVVSGKVELRSKGKSSVYRAGDRFFIDANVPHEATVHAGYRAVVIFNSPDRFKTKIP
jgi:quercetin dioxygenase-like cupin family protein